MKCNRYAIYGWKSKKGMKNPPKVLGSFKDLATMEGASDNPIRLMSHAESCNGEIESQIKLEYIPYMGGESAVIEVRFKCKRCGYEFSGDNGLPYDVDSLNKFLTKIIGEM